ncbi:hypothetical protein HRbin40_02362 [bacterium HR40]|nr:hypothetical protein HRbin40_02362 [bacterium HR40]
MRVLPSLVLCLGLAACAEVQQVGMLAIEKRRVMNDMQARATMAATCDIALGAYFRELSELERQYAALVCGGQFPDGARRQPATFRDEAATGPGARLPAVP